MSEIIWYLSLSDWLISLSIMLSRSIHMVAKGKIFPVFQSIFKVFPFILCFLLSMWHCARQGARHHCRHRRAEVSVKGTRSAPAHTPQCSPFWAMRQLLIVTLPGACLQDIVVLASCLKDKLELVQLLFFQVGQVWAAL